MNFCVAILVLKMKEDGQHFQCIMLHYFKKGKNITEMQKKRSVQFMEKVMWRTECVKSGLQNFLVLLTFWPNDSLLWGLCTERGLAAPLPFTHQKPIAGDSLHTQNIQINKVTGDNEKCVFYFTEETIRTFWPTLYTHTHTHTHIYIHNGHVTTV